LQDCLARHKITKVSGVGSKFSYDHHQAMQQVDSQTHESNTIIQVLQEGYVIHDRLLRPAMVIVAK
ncbi:MAG: nucleotide exchange factor GrpE, partial [Alphaproteobacteria bacterium]